MGRGPPHGPAYFPCPIRVSIFDIDVKLLYKKYFTVVKNDYTEASLFVQKNSNYKKTIWLATPAEQQQMIHLDFYVKANQFDERVKYTIPCGAKMAKNQFSSDWKVMIDISGHPLCIIPIPKEVYEQRHGS